jgi:hypothetical protein
MNITKSNRITRTYNVNQVLYQDAKRCAEKDGKYLSRILELALERYVAARQ